MKPLQEKLKKKKRIKILIIRLKPIGDAVLISSVFRNIKKMYPQALVHIIVYPFVYPVIQNNPNIDKLIILKRDNFHKFIFYMQSFFKYYDIIIDYINNPTSTLIAFFTHSGYIIGNKNRRNFFYHYRNTSDEKEYSAIRSLKLLKPLGLNNFEDYMPEIFLDKKDVIMADKLLSCLKLKKNIIGLFVSAKYTSRQYPPENFAKLAQLIVKKTPNQALFLFGKDDIETLFTIQKKIKEQTNISYISPQITIGELAAIISKLKFLITNDTGPKHLATAQKIPTFTIYSSTDEAVWNPPDRKKHPFIREKIDCAPCNKLSCPKNTTECMTNLSPEKIFNKLKKYIR